MSQRIQVQELGEQQEQEKQESQEQEKREPHGRDRRKAGRSDQVGITARNAARPSLHATPHLSRGRTLPAAPRGAGQVRPGTLCSRGSSGRLGSLGTKCNLQGWSHWAGLRQAATGGRRTCWRSPRRSWISFASDEGGAWTFLPSSDERPSRTGGAGARHPIR